MRRGNKTESQGQFAAEDSGPITWIEAHRSHIAHSAQLRRQWGMGQQQGPVLEDRTRAPALRAAHDLESLADEVFGIAIGEAEQWSCVRAGGSDLPTTRGNDSPGAEQAGDCRVKCPIEGHMMAGEGV